MWAVNMLPWRAEAKAKLRFQIRYELAILGISIITVILSVQSYIDYLQTQRRGMIETVQAKIQKQNALLTGQTEKQAQHAIVTALPELQQMQHAQWRSIVECVEILEIAKSRDIALHSIRYQWPLIRVLGSAGAELRIFDFVERVQQKLPMAMVKVEQLKATGRKTQRDIFEFSMEIKQKHPSWLNSEHIFKPLLQDSPPLIEIPE